MRVDVILRQTIEFARLNLNRSHILPYVLVEIVTDGGDLIFKIANVLSRHFILVHTRTPEGSQRFFDHKTLNSI